MVNFGPVCTAMITPFKENGDVNFRVAEKLAVYLAENGTDTVLLCGTTGESPTLTKDEEFELFRAVKNALNGKAKVLVGTGSNSTREAIAATEKAAKLGVDGSLQVVPYYNKPSQDGLYQHFAAVAKTCSDMPTILYNIPGRTGINMEPDTVVRLAEIPNIIGIKEASGKLDQASEIRQKTPADFSIYSGDDSLTLPIMAVGGKGVISVAAHLVGKELQEMIQSFETGNVKHAAQIHQKLYPLFKALFLTTNPAPVKLALKLQGWDVGSTRLPLCDPPDDIERKLTTVMKDLNLL